MKMSERKILYAIEICQMGKHNQATINAKNEEENTIKYTNAGKPRVPTQKPLLSGGPLNLRQIQFAI